MKKLSGFLLGLVLILVLTPIAQFSTIAMTNHDLETSAASGWVFGLLTTLVLVLAGFHLIRKSRATNRQGLVIVFCMLSMAVPVMNLGFSRLLIHALNSVQDHFLSHGVDTYRRAYQELDPDWYPVVPTAEGLAEAKSDQALKLLSDSSVLQARRGTLQTLSLSLQSTERRLARAETVPEDFVEQWQSLIPKLGILELESLSREMLRYEKAVAALGEDANLEPRIQTLREASAEALSALTDSVPDEAELYWVPSIYKNQLDQATRKRLDVQETLMTPEEFAALKAKAQAIEGDSLNSLRTQVMALSNADHSQLLSSLSEAYLRNWETLSEEEVAHIRTDFLHRLRTSDRKSVFSGDDEDMSTLKESVFKDSAELDAFRELSAPEKLSTVWGQIPWKLWRGPIIRWSAVAILFIAFFTFLAEWLRRKWVERENLAFPLVDVADNLIRHDYKLETAEDLMHPEPRKSLFSGAFWMGFALGAVILLAEGISYYRGGEGVMALDVTKRLFSSGTLQQFNKFVFVLSPILLGLFFLVSLEISFSVWVIYLIFRVAFFMIGLGSQGGIRDSAYVGWASRSFPFEQEQMLGAGVCMGILLLIKAWGAGKKQGSASNANEDSGRAFPDVVMIAGLVVTPILLMMLFWDLGMQQPLLFLIFFAVLVLLAITAARLRAETGLPLQHVHYDFTRIPLILGLSRMTSVKSLLNFIPLVFLPVTLITRMLPQQLENFELARRHQMKGRTVALAGFAAASLAVVWGLISLLTMSHWMGEEVLGGGTQAGRATSGIMAYPLWVFHFLGEQGLDSFTGLHETRLWFVVIGALTFGALTLVRNKILGFPLHPLGYMLLLFSVYSSWLSPYHKSAETANLDGASWLWGSAFAAWMIKRLIIKYGGMNSYRAAKPAFVGLIVGSLFALFLMNSVDLLVSANTDQNDSDPSALEKTFLENPSFSPKVY